MIVLDENIPDGQRLALEASRLAPRQVGFDIGRKGLKDDRIIVFLRQQRNITFFTRDGDFYLPELRHRNYCLVVMSVGQNEVAAFIRRFLRHRDFDTGAKRMGKVVRVSHVSLAVWQLKSPIEVHTVWTDPDSAPTAIIRCSCQPVADYCMKLYDYVSGCLSTSFWSS